MSIMAALIIVFTNSYGFPCKTIIGQYYCNMHVYCYEVLCYDEFTSAFTTFAHELAWSFFLRFMLDNLPRNSSKLSGIQFNNDVLSRC